MISKGVHEIRDPIHVFVRLDSNERKVLDSLPFQRLRHIHQLALTYLVYPGATHRRFEHSLGVMELAGRVYDVVTNPAHIFHDSVRKVVPANNSYEYEYWRVVLRMAALCHDLGHLPFSHGAEQDLLPEGWDHERLTVEIIFSDEMRDIWRQIKIQPDDVAKLAVGPQKYRKVQFNDWEAILAEIIIGDAFGVDRIDYLLRDSHHAGVAYGKFDHYRLIDTLRILPKEEDGSIEPCLGVDEGGLQSAEALLWARYFMYSQVYFHHVRRIYDIHLKDFLKKWLPEEHFPVTVADHLRLTDNETFLPTQS
jgi:HD superfamily phosphohydrolase